MSKITPAKVPHPNGYRQGLFIPTNTQKYRGDVNKIRFMSSWELKVFHFLDGNPNILEWSSEGVVVPYIKPTDGKIHKYYVDCWVKYRNKLGEIVEELWEIKPKKQTKPPTRRGKSKKTQLNETILHEINKAKWNSARLLCEKRGWVFRLITEDSLFK